MLLWKLRGLAVDYFEQDPSATILGVISGGLLQYDQYFVPKVARGPTAPDVAMGDFSNLISIPQPGKCRTASCRNVMLVVWLNEANSSLSREACAFVRSSTSVWFSRASIYFSSKVIADNLGKEAIMACKQ